MDYGRPMYQGLAARAVAVVVILVGCGKDPGEGAADISPVTRRGEDPGDETTESSPVTYHKKDDPEMLRANGEARKTFRYFWREVSWDFNRIVPGVELACVKLAFSDDPSDPDSRVEHMWVGDIDFDGERIRGVLVNSPNWLSSFKEGDSIECSPDEIGDWMCVVGGKVYGAYTVQVTRGRMDDSERSAYDAQWGLEFPPPDEVLVPSENAKFGAVIASKLKEHFNENPDTVHSPDDSGRTLLHLSALYGRKQSVKVLLEHGVDVARRCSRGWKAIDYAQALGWSEIAEMLSKAEGGEGDGADEVKTQR